MVEAVFRPKADHPRAGVAEVMAQNKCFQRFVANVAKIAKCHLDQVETDLFSAAIVLKNRAVAMTDQGLLQKDLMVETAIQLHASALRITARSLPA